MIELSGMALAAGISPPFGGGLAYFDAWREGVRVPLMRPLRSPAMSPDAFEPNRLACYPLVPWSNRIDRGGFEVDGAHVALLPNRADDPYPIHGTAWQRAWRVEQDGPDGALLVLDDATPGAYTYRAEQRYALRGDTLRIALTVRNEGEAPLPFGLGLHPFFLHHDGARLRAAATQVWLNDGHSPIPVERVAVPSAWDFRAGRALPDEEINHCFVEWDGHATIEWPGLGLALDLAADMDAFILYTPVGADFFCFEPVDHCIDAVHRPGGALANGMTRLAPGERLTRHVAFRVRPLVADAAPLSPFGT
ncbi:MULTISPECIES: aldose 1-epimerase [unclassified Dyella]|uniref:aldose 1-epimerase n=1 Tax=unclassified Dyella TaxID=2634549 RepID=UPI000CB62542|nr:MULTISPECIES: aldose 1-epimerase [unclassified Dyella]MDR3443774.1 aldose 1-epimerase [Dyella sp.]PMQ03331.1 Aldose 1-epimerase [Dyella sp. AD56]